MDFRILGPLEIRDGCERPVEVRGAKQRLVLAVLLLQANEVVSTDRLIDALWGESPPPTAPKALQMHVSELRKVLGRDLIATRPPGYELRLDPDQLDLWRFEHALREAKATADTGRLAEAARGLGDALALWRGPPLADLGFEEVLQPAIAQLEELRLVALEERIDIDLALGRHPELISELESLSAQHPLRERLRGQLILALYRSGRQAEALEAYRNLRRILVDELGIEPGRALRELEAAVLAQDEALDTPSLPPAEPDDEELIGRAREMAKVLPVVERVAAGRGGGVIVVGGEPGIGKSRFAQAVAAEMEQRGARVLVGRCWEAGDAPAYWPWTQALRPLLSGQGLEPLAPSDATGSPGARFQLFEAVAELLREVAADRPLAVLFDDLHAADAPSLLLLRFAARALEDASVLIVGCYRDTEVGTGLEEALAELTRHRTAVPLALEGIDSDGTRELLEVAMVRAPSAQLAELVHARTGGNPLFAAEVGRLLASGDWDEEAIVQRGFPMPQGVRAAIASRIQRESDDCRDLMALASVVGREFDLPLLGQLSALDEDQLLSVLEEAHAARIVESVPGGRGRLRFSHVLVRDALYDQLSPTRRLELHRDVAEAIETLYPSALGPRASELAGHYREAGPAQLPKALDYAIRAGDHAAEHLGYEHAARHYEDALELMQAAGSDRSRPCEVTLCLGDVLSRAGDGAAAKAAFRRAAVGAEELDDADRLARAALGYGGRFSWARAGTDPELVPLYERALDALGEGDSAARAMLLARLASALRDEPPRARRLALADEALAIARRIGDAHVIARTLDAVFAARETPDTTTDRIHNADELVALAGQIGDQELAYQGHAHGFHTLWSLGDRAGIEVRLGALDRIVDALGQPAQRWDHATQHASLALMEGRFDDAEEFAAQALEHGRRAESWNARVSHLFASFVLYRERGRLSELEDALQRAVHEYPALLRFHTALVHLYAELGREREARRAFDRFMARDLTEHFDSEWLVHMLLLAAPCAYLGDETAAGRLYELLAPYRDLYAEAPCEASVGAVAGGLGVLATTMARYDEAESHFERALEIERTLHAWPWLAHAQDNFARMLLVRGGEGDESRASELVAEAGKTYRRLGMDVWADRLTAGATIGQSRK